MCTKLSVLLFLFQTVNDELETNEENEEDIEYIVERLETDDEDMVETQEVKNEIEELAGEQREKEIDQDLCAQLQSDDEDSKPVIKKIKLMNKVIYI